MSDAPTPAAAPGPGTGRRIAIISVLLAASQIGSRLLGLVRDAVLGAQVGVNDRTDAYAAAFQIPDLLNYLLAGGALTIAFLPLYTKARAEGGEVAGAGLFHVVLGTLAVAVVALTALLFLYADAGVALLFPAFDAEQQALTARLTRIVLPAQIAFVAGGVIRAVCMAHDRFWSQALAPVVYNLAIIAGGLVLAPSLGVEGFAWGALAGAVVGALVIPAIELRGTGVRLGLRVAPLDPRFRRYLWTALPLMIGVTLLTVDEWYERIFGQLGGEGTIASLTFARRLMLVSVGVVGQAVATAALPTLARLHAQGRGAELGKLVQDMLQAALGVALVAAAATFVLAGPMVTLVYERGAFGPEETARVAGLLRILAFAIPCWVVLQLAVRPFYARGDMWRPMLVGTATALLALPLYAGLARRYGGPGLAAAGAVAIGVNALATLALARRWHGAPDLRVLGAALLRGTAIAAVAALVTGSLLPGKPGFAGALLDAVLGGALVVALCGIGVAWLGDAPTREALLRIVRRVHPGRDDA